MSKKIHVLIFDSKREKILTFNRGLPHLETTEEDTFSVANRCIEDYVNASCCMMTRLFNTDAFEIWQTLEVFLPEDAWWETHRVAFAWVTIEGLDWAQPELEVSKWKEFIYKRNLALQVAEKIEKEHWKELDQQLSERA